MLGSLTQILLVFLLITIWILLFSMAWKLLPTGETEEKVDIPTRFNLIIAFCLTFFLTELIKILSSTGLKLEGSQLGQRLAVGFAFIVGTAIIFGLKRILNLPLPLVSNNKLTALAPMIGLTIVSFIGLYFIVNMALDLNKEILKHFNLVVNEHPVIEQLKSPESSKALFWISALLTVIIVPVYEELMFRGYLHRCCTSALGLHAGIIVQSYFFAIVHPISTYFPIFILALGLSYTRHWSKSLWPSIMMHVMLNGSTMALIYIQVIDGKV